MQVLNCQRPRMEYAIPPGSAQGRSDRDLPRFACEQPHTPIATGSDRQRPGNRIRKPHPNVYGREATQAFRPHIARRRIRPGPEPDLAPFQLRPTHQLGTQAGMSQRLPKEAIGSLVQLLEQPMLRLGIAILTKSPTQVAWVIIWAVELTVRFDIN